MNWLARRLLRISSRNVSFQERGFHIGDHTPRRHLEEIGRTFLYGYHLALDLRDLRAFGDRLKEVPLENQGFAFEGAGMALGIQETWSLRSRSRLRRFLSGPAQQHLYMVHVGVGWAMARLPWSRWRTLGKS